MKIHSILKAVSLFCSTAIGVCLFFIYKGVWQTGFFVLSMLFFVGIELVVFVLIDWDVELTSATMDLTRKVVAISDKMSKEAVSEKKDGE